MPQNTAPIQHGANTIGTSAEQLDDSEDRLNNGVLIKSLSTNSGTVYVGSSDDVTSSDGFPLEAGESLHLEAVSPSDVWLIGSAAGQAVRWIAT